MVPTPPNPDHELIRQMAALPREAPPSIPLESIFERSAAAGRRRFLVGGLGGAALLLVLVLFRLPGSDEAPVHRDLRLFDVSPAGDAERLAGPVDPWEEPAP